jgi:hypothetical protein
MHVYSRDSPQSFELWEDGRQSGNYQLINIKMPAGCFVPRLVMENAPAYRETALPNYRSLAKTYRYE